MPNTNRKSGSSLILVGLLGILFFWLTDPRYGLALHWNHGENPVDLANQQFPGTVVGIAASILIVLIGAYLWSRRTV
jgi:hypothetical protein